MKAYLAAPFGTPDSMERQNVMRADDILTNIHGLDVYCPWKMTIQNAWDFPNTEWGLMVFEADVQHIQEADIVIVLSYGRKCTAGTVWESGYAFGLGKKVILVEMTDNVMSLMMSNGRYATVRGLDGLKEYDFVTFPKTRTDTEQK